MKIKMKRIVSKKKGKVMMTMMRMKNQMKKRRKNLKRNLPLLLLRRSLRYQEDCPTVALNFVCHAK